MSVPPEESEAWKTQDKGPIILSVCWSVTAVSSLFVLGRIFAGYQRGKFHWDDWFVMLAQFFSYASTAFSTMAIRYGNGKHMKLLSTEQQEGAIFWTTVAFCPGILSFGLPKLAVVSLVTRLMNPSRYHKYFLCFIGVFCQVVLLITAALLLTRCNPPNSLWDFSVAGTCFSTDILVGFSIFAASLSAFVDVYLAVYPSVVLLNLQMTLKKKVALSWALGIGVM
ncbi:hypothetical protein C8034_v006390 [Colletotrichum sidae]|uniref:Rhodopsin domain-containing protein n=1 Tax=Colletotrichum sidae TaxID=1347389 RepID=A0A4R8T4M7_9PEZI|nr:hypothetical protein C8034_v006390 [Colletotrichum sidae]